MAPPPKDGSRKAVLRVHQYDPISETAKKKCIIELEDSRTIMNGKLGTIRKLLAKERVFSSLDVTSPFCDVDGSCVSDEMSFSVYLTQVESSNKEESQSTRTRSSTCEEIDLYYKKRKLRTELNQTAKDFLNKGVDLTLKKSPELLKTNTPLLKSTFDAGLLLAKAGTLTLAADLTEHDWSIIMRTNCILNGYSLVEYEKPAVDGKMVTAMKVERSPYNAFALRPRNFEPYEISAPPQRAGVTEGIETKLEAPTYHYRIPRFQVDDDSYVTVFETKSSLQHSMASSSFSEASVEASAGGGFWGGSAAFSGGFATSQSGQHMDGSESKDEKINISYNFPRVTLFLDPSCLEITKECEADIDKLADEQSFKDFGQKYGHVFARRVELGGRLSSSQHSEATSKSEINEKLNSLKISAAASFSSAYTQASVSGNHQSGGASSTTDASQKLQHSMAWEATGGDTLLCNNPPSWCATVSDFHNWRVIQRHNVLPLCKVLSYFPKYRHVAKMFECAPQDNFRTIQFKLIEEETGQQLKLCKNDSTLHKQMVDNFNERAPADGEIGRPEFGVMLAALRSRTSIRCDPSASGNSLWETRVPVGLTDEDAICHETNICIQPPGSSQYLGCTWSLLGKEGRGDRFQYYLALRNEETYCWLQTPGLSKKKGPIKPDDSIEVCILRAWNGSSMGLLTKTDNEQNGLIGIEPYDQKHLNKSLSFKLKRS